MKRICPCATANQRPVSSLPGRRGPWMVPHIQTSSGAAWLKRRDSGLILLRHYFTFLTSSESQLSKQHWLFFPGQERHFSFWPRYAACKILVLQPGIDPAVEAWVLTTGQPGKSQEKHFQCPFFSRNKWCWFPSIPLGKSECGRCWGYRYVISVSSVLCGSDAWAPVSMGRRWHLLYQQHPLPSMPSAKVLLLSYHAKPSPMKVVPTSVELLENRTSRCNAVPVGV